MVNEAAVSLVQPYPPGSGDRESGLQAIINVNKEQVMRFCQERMRSVGLWSGLRKLSRTARMASRAARRCLRHGEMATPDWATPD